MAKAKSKIVLGTVRAIPFNQLVLSQSNVRRVAAGVSIEQLADDIARRGLLQSLNVRPVLDDDGNPGDTYEIPAGGRRYRALELLMKQKRMSRTEPVPCIVVAADSATAIEEDSLAENVQRADLHPLDQYRAFEALRGKGIGEDEIAARFFVPVSVVKQRLKLAAVSPKLLDVYAEGEIALDQLMAFTVNDDHERQEQVWEALRTGMNRGAYYIRRALTENSVRVADRRVRFVTVAAYEAAGGIVLRDLFEADDGGWVQDVALLEKLVADKLKVEAEAVAAEGWKWVETAIGFAYGYSYSLDRIEGLPAELTDEEKASLDALVAEQERLETEYEDADELPEEVDRRLGEIETAIAAFDGRSAVYDPDQIKYAGAFVSIGHDGALLVERGYVKPEDAPASADDDNAEVQDGEHDDEAAGEVPAGGVGEEQDNVEEDDGDRPLPDRLLTELTAYRTLALRNAVAGNPDVALTLLLHKLISDRFGTWGTSGCLQLTLQEARFPVQSSDLADSPAAIAIDERDEAWKSDIPGGDDTLWDWLTTLDEPSRMALLAHCVSYGVNALHEKAAPYGTGPSSHAIRQRLRQADRLAEATELDMVEAGWTVTTANYLGRVTKSQICDAVREAKGEQAAQLIDHLKKAEMADRAQDLLAGTGWLPVALRTPGVEPHVWPDGATNEPSAEDESMTDIPAVAAE
jgi:ParB family chromosome partitioning protein